ncbi:MAG: phosphoribosyl-AMP cyclohydrolase [Deltaproteobacteria bacterium]|jgi:phosphoribosyl-AMP cyclohydrolase|nr:phosphoribosyl-AMP cyclohydrolase [Myxococcales bacterium]TDJ12438.1 MAG: phosphoribosyl-AMP cyclohydrolase [Deltaproteobacteria bacterium]
MDPLNALDFEKGDGLVTAIALDDATGDVLMVAFMNELSLRRTIETGEVHYWSRSRGKLWRKGEQSGNTQQLKSLYIDCDGDCVVVRVEQIGRAACHTGKRSCFYRRLEDGRWVDEGEQVFDPKEVYGK